MATLDEEKQQRKDLRTSLDSVLNIQPESLVREEELGKQLNFKQGLTYFIRIHKLFKELSECIFDDVPYRTLRTLTNHTNEVLGSLNAIRGFSIDQSSNPTAQRNSFLKGPQDVWEKITPDIKEYIAYAHPRVKEMGGLVQQAEGAIAKVKEKEAELGAQADKILKGMQDSEAAVRATVAKVGVGHHAINFEEEAKSHRRQAYYWLAAAALFAGGIVGYAIYYLPTQLGEDSGGVLTARLVQLILSRVIVVSILSFGLVFCGRQYAASRHNFVVNRHRQNALRSFETFASAAIEPATKDSVLIQATRAIFDPQASGYSKGDQGPQPSSHLTEIVRGVTGPQAS